jgi:excinuclease ABC subunit C
VGSGVLQNNFDAAAFLKNMTTRPGIYNMLNDKSEIIYIGKAKNHKKTAFPAILKRKRHRSNSR